MINPYIRKDLIDFKPYHAPKKAYDIKVDANENPFQHPEAVLKKAMTFFEDKDLMTRYPDTDNTDLRNKISSLYGISSDQVTCGVGSDQLIEYIIKAMVEPGDTVLVPNPSFSMYGLSTILNHGISISYELNDEFGYPVEEIIDLVKTNHPKLLFVCSPNNPTGSMISEVDLINILEHVECPVVVDEAYSEFINSSIVDQIDQYPNLIVLRTFSKAMGLAGLRVGYAIASKLMIDTINICKAPYNLSTFSQVMATIVLENVDYYQEMVKEIILQREILQKKLKSFGQIDKIYPSNANFILIRVKDIALSDYLEQNKVLVRPYHEEGRLKNCIRLTVGTKLENERLLKLLVEYQINHV